MSFLEDHGNYPSAASARFQLAQVQHAAGKQEEAVASLQELARKVTGLEKVACLYLAKQWKPR